MAKSFIFLIMAFLLLFTAQCRHLSTSIKQQVDIPKIPFSSPEWSSIDEECKGLDEDACLVKRSLAAHTDYIYTQQNIVP
ncbi:hypothetical protein Gotri_014825 [Gossypium trilobum]|uniref:Phytosulfokine n=2 Tax=Gossypium TaxID=3633 RepID=A0A7J9J287_9ROSI|nr:hypothetical protein [Gossypium trilobum]MBA0828479.1 hypothetical protein [Gossypium armourianum]